MAQRLDTLLRIIPDGIEEYTTVLGLLGFLLFLLSPRVKPKLKAAFAFVLMFVMLSRMELSRFREISSRHVSVMIIPFILFAVFFLNQLYQKRIHIVRWCVAIIMVVMLLIYMEGDLKRNKKDMNYYAIAEIVKKSDMDRKEEEFLVTGKDLSRISFLSQTDNIENAIDVDCPYKNNFGKTFYPSIIDIDFNNSVIPDGSKKQIFSFVTGKNSKKRIKLFYSARSPSIHLQVNPAPAKIDTSKSILKNGSIEAFDSPQESHKKLVNHVLNYSSFFEYDESVRTPQNAYFQVTSGAEKKPSLGIESVRAIDGQNSVSIKFNEGNAILYFSQKFYNGQYSYSFLIQGKKGTMIQPVYCIHSDGKWNRTPICSFTIPDSRAFQISCSFDIDCLKDNDFFIVGARVLNGETLLDDFILNRKEFN